MTVRQINSKNQKRALQTKRGGWARLGVEGQGLRMVGTDWDAGVFVAILST